MSEETTEKIAGVPLIFMFQPTEFVVVKGDKLSEWEEQMRTSVGLGDVATLATARAEMGVETTSLCPGGGADDCDFHVLAQ